MGVPIAPRPMNPIFMMSPFEKTIRRFHRLGMAPGVNHDASEIETLDAGKIEDNPPMNAD